MTKMPALFIGHGSPMNTLERNDYTEAWRAFGQHLPRPKAILTVAGVSMGGGVSMITFGSDDPPPADRLVLLSPAVWGWSTQPLPNRTALWIVGKTAPGLDIDPPRLFANFFKPTDNVPEMLRMRDDPLMTWGTRTDTLYGVVDLMQKASASSPASGTSRSGRMRRGGGSSS